VDARGSAGTIFADHYGLDRPIWRNTTNPTSAYDTYSYDSTAGGSAGIGRLTSETFSAGAVRELHLRRPGTADASALTVGGTSYPLGSTCDGAGNALTQTYPDGETINNIQEWHSRAIRHFR
jgi:hypothetical protein